MHLGIPGYQGHGGIHLGIPGYRWTQDGFGPEQPSGVPWGDPFSSPMKPLGPKLSR